MSSCLLSSSPLSPPSLPLLSPPLFHSSPNPPLFFSSPPRRHSITCSTATGAKESFAEEESKREFLERYGLDPSEFGPKLPRKGMRGRKEEGRGRRGKEASLSPLKPPRTTHKLLQVLGGKARRKKLLSPKGMDVRPMMELVRGAAFDIIQVAGGCPASLRPGRWLDLYSGTGSVGIEALSRGCSEAHFIEMDPWVVSDVLRPNLESTGFLDVSVIHMTRVENFLQQATQSLGVSDYSLFGEM